MSTQLGLKQEQNNAIALATSETYFCQNLHNLCKNFPFRRDETKSQHLDQGGSTLSRELESSTFKLGFSSAKKAKDQIENLSLYLNSELIQSLLAFIFTYRYHQAGLRLLVLMSYNKPLCDMYHGIMNLCSVLTWFGRAAFLNAGK